MVTAASVAVSRRIKGHHHARRERSFFLLLMTMKLDISRSGWSQSSCAARRFGWPRRIRPRGRRANHLTETANRCVDSRQTNLANLARRPRTRHRPGSETQSTRSALRGTLLFRCAPGEDRTRRRPLSSRVLVRLVAASSGFLLLRGMVPQGLQPARSTLQPRLRGRFSWGSFHLSARRQAKVGDSPPAKRDGQSRDQLDANWKVSRSVKVCPITCMPEGIRSSTKPSGTSMTG